MATMKVKADARDPHKKSGARDLRRKGLIPGIVYGQGKNSLPVSFDRNEFDSLLRTREGTVIIEIDMPDQDPQPTIIREIQRDPVTGQVLHIDLMHISMTERVQVEVPLNVVGLAVGVKTDGGVLEHHLRRLEIKCLPFDIPASIDVDVTELTIGKAVHVNELPIDRDKLELVTEESTTIVSVIPPRIVKLEAEAEPVEGEEAEEDAEGAEGEKADEKAGEGEKDSS